MTYSAWLKDEESGEVREVQMGEWADGCLFGWTEGNFSCDCNRGDFFYEPDYAGQSFPCNTGPNRFTLLGLVSEDGRVFWGTPGLTIEESSVLDKEAWEKLRRYAGGPDAGKILTFLPPFRLS